MTYVCVNFLVILYISFVSLVSWFNILCMENLIGLFFTCRGGLGCWDCCGRGGCRGFIGILGVKSLLSDMYCILSVRAWGWLSHVVGPFWLQLGW